MEREREADALRPEADRDLERVIRAVLDANGIDDAQLLRDLLGIAKSERSAGLTPPRAPERCTCGNNFANPEPYCPKHDAARPLAPSGTPAKEHTQADYDRERETQMAPTLTTDDYYALLRIIEILPVADPFLTNLQTKISNDERARHGNRASHLSGPEFVREVERVEARIRAQFAGPSAEETDADEVTRLRGVVTEIARESHGWKQRAEQADAAHAALRDECRRWRAAMAYLVGDVADTGTPEECRAAWDRQQADARDAEARLAALHTRLDGLPRYSMRWSHGEGAEGALARADGRWVKLDDLLAALREEQA